MALVLADRVQETTTTAGTGALTLSGAVSGFQSFAVVGNANTCYYTIVDSPAWEVGIGTYSTTGPTLTRTTVLSNSSGTTSPLTLSAAAKPVFLTYPAEKSVNLDASGNVSPLGTVASGTWQGTTVATAYGGTGVTTSTGANSNVLRDANGNITVNNVFAGFTSTATAGTTTTLTAASTSYQRFTGTLAQTVKLPDATTLQAGFIFIIDCDSTVALSIIDAASGALDTIYPGGVANYVLLSNATVAGTWIAYGQVPSDVDWGTNTLRLSTTVVTGGTWNGGTITGAYGGTGLTTFSAANNAVYSTGATTLTAGTLPVLAGGTGVTTSTGSGSNVLSTSPTLVTPLLGTPTSGNFSTGTFTWPTFNQSTTGNATTATTSTNLAGGSAGTIPYQSAAGTTVQLGAGTSGYVLQANGAAAPSWVVASTAAGVNNGTLTMAVAGTGLSGSQTFTANQSTGATFTVTSNATNANTASTIVARDASGNFTAGTITAALSGNATTATSATTAGTITSQANSATITAATANTASTIVLRDASGNFSAGTITAALSGNASTATSASTLNGYTQNASSGANTIVQRDTSGYIQNNYFYTSGGGSERNASGMGYFAGFNSSDYYIRSYTPAAVASAISGQTMNIAGSSTSCSGNAATATTLTGDQTNWASNRTNAVANMLGWKNYGNAHVIFDASASTSPTGSAVNNTNAATAWSAAYPTLMGWNGGSTYGVRVDSARVADNTTGSSASCTGNAATATTATNVNAVNGYVFHSGSDTLPAVVMNSDGSYYGHVARRTTQQWGMGWGNGSGTATTFGIYYDTSGNFTATGNVTAYSDERVKKDWADIGFDFVEQLAQVKHGTYTRTDIETNMRQAGVSAQAWQKILPETVETDKLTGLLSVAYGNAALVSAVELAKRVVEQDARIARLEALVAKLLES